MVVGGADNKVIIMGIRARREQPIPNLEELQERYHDPGLQARFAEMDDTMNSKILMPSFVMPHTGGIRTGGEKGRIVRHVTRHVHPTY